MTEFSFHLPVLFTCDYLLVVQNGTIFPRREVHGFTLAMEKRWDLS